MIISFSCRAPAQRSATPNTRNCTESAALSAADSPPPTLQVLTAFFKHKLSALRQISECSLEGLLAESVLANADSAAADSAAADDADVPMAPEERNVVGGTGESDVLPLTAGEVRLCNEQFFCSETRNCRSLTISQHTHALNHKGQTQAHQPVR